MSRIAGAIGPIVGRPGTQTRVDAAFRLIFADGKPAFAPGKGVVNGAKSRDPNNTAGYTHHLRAGLVMAKNSTSGFYAPWAIGVSTAGLLGNGTTLTIGAAEATELVRRVGSTGTFVLTGVDKTGGSVRSATVTYSAVNTTNGQVTITAVGTVNQVDRIRFNIASTGGNIQLTVQKTDGTLVTTANAAWNATDATYLAAINSALDTATGVAGGIVASASAGIDTDIELVLTYSGTGYTGKSWTQAAVAVLPTSSTVAYVSTVAAGSGSFATGSVVSEVGWSTPLTMVAESIGVVVPTDGSNCEMAVPDASRIISAQLLPYPSDSTLLLWMQQQMSTPQGGKYIFDNVT